MSASTLSSRIARRLWPLAVLVAFALPLLTAGPAAADADPASDILLGSQVFYPYQPAVSPALQRQLEQKLGGLKANGMNLKVAIIQSPVDLGALPSIFGKPQQYAEFLDREISFQKPQPLLVVMPNGFGLVHAGPLSSVAGLKIDKAAEVQRPRRRRGPGRRPDRQGQRQVDHGRVGGVVIELGRRRDLAGDHLRNPDPGDRAGRRGRAGASPTGRGARVSEPPVLASEFHGRGYTQRGRGARGPRA